MNQLTASVASAAISSASDEDDRTPAETAREHTVDTDSITCRAAGLYCASAGYDEALRMPNPTVTLDRMVEAVDEIMPDVAKVVGVEGAEFAELLRAATVAPLQAFAAVEHARAEAAAEDCGYLFDIMVDCLKAGADPRIIRRSALAAPARLRELAQDAE